MDKKGHIQQWQKYNPLDKIEPDIRHDKSNKYPYCISEKLTTVQDLLKPKISSIGVVPLRETREVNELSVMIIGKSTLPPDKEKDEKIHEEDGKSEVNQVSATSEETKHQRESRKKKEKMPAIVASVGTTSNIKFSERKKPKETPMTKLKSKKIAKPSLILVPPNSRTSKRSSSIHSKHSEEIRTSVENAPSHSEAPPSSPVTKEDTSSLPEVRQTASARSVDEIIKNLRNSREGTEQRSSSDLRIDELMRQVMYHSEEWSKKEEDTNVLEESKGPEGAQEELTPHLSISDHEEEIDISDTVSTLASQISAPAGIPDVAAILLRKSSDTANRAGADSEYSGFSSPVLGAGVTDEYVDAAQAFKDLNETLDVKNEDILCVKGQQPPTINFEPISEDEGYFDGISSGSSSSRLPPAGLTTTVTTGGRIHHLCLLTADSASQFDVTPSDAALSRILHAADRHRAALSTIKGFRKEGSPPAPPPSENNIPKECDDDQDSTMKTVVPSVLEEVEQYNRRALLATEESDGEHEPGIEKKDSAELDTSKIDPLDMDGWRKLAEGTFEKKDYTQQGERCIGRESNIWRLIWDPAPPKMLIPPVAVKAALFPHYHGAQAMADTEDGDLDESQFEDLDSDEEEEKDHDKTEFNYLSIYRKHKSEEDLPSLIKKKPDEDLQRPPSVPDISPSHPPDTRFVNLKADYSNAMEELQMQRTILLQQEEEAKMVPGVADIPTSGTGYDIKPKTPGQISPTKPENAATMEEPSSIKPKMSLAELSRQGGQEYVPRRSKSRKKARE